MKNQRGITLFVLIITIIVILILVGITLVTIIGDDGVIQRAQDAQERQKYELAKEKILIQSVYIDKGEEIGKIDLSVTEDNIKALMLDEIEEIIAKPELLTVILKNGSKVEIPGKNGRTTIEEENEGILNYEYDDTTMTAKVTGFKNSNDTATELTIPSFKIKGNNKYEVTTIGESAFNNCSALKSIEIPNVTSINQYAFQKCTALTSIEMPNVTSIEKSAFSFCSALKKIEMSNIISIGHQAFYSCGLEKVELPISLIEITDGWIFFNCKNLTDIYCPGREKAPEGWNTQWQAGAYSNSNGKVKVHWGESMSR